MSHYPTEMIALTTPDGFRVTNAGDILCCIADGSYTTVRLMDNTSYKLSKRLNLIESELPGELFLRIHSHYLVNKMHVRQYTKNDGHKLLLSNGQWLPIAERRKKAVLENFKIL